MLCRLLGCGRRRDADELERPPPPAAATPRPAKLPPGTPPSGSSTASVASELPIKPPAPPAPWHVVAEADESDGETLTKDVEIELEQREVTIVDDDDDATDDAVAFADAWASFRGQRDPGFSKLRSYCRAHYSSLLRMLLAPRREVCAGRLGPDAFTFRGRSIVREDFEVMSDRQHTLQCSLWRDDLGLGKRIYRWRQKRACVLYVHDVGGSRLGALSCLGVALDAGCSGYCALDTCACGESGGRRVSFGSLERWDVACVMQELVQRRNFTEVILWGRGAGAVACVLYAAETVERPVATSYFGETYAYLGVEDGVKEAYPAAVEVSLDVMNVDEFLRGTEVQPTCYMWVASKPPVQVSKVGAYAYEKGLRIGDVINGVGSSTRLPHSQEELTNQLAHLTAKPRKQPLQLHVFRTRTDAKERRKAFFGEALPRPTALILDCVVDSPPDVVDALKTHAAEREPILTGLLEPLLATALEVLCHSIEKRAHVDPRSVHCAKAVASLTMPALYGMNDYADVDRGVPRLASTSKLVFAAHGGSSKELCRYNAPLRLALRGSLDAMAPGFLQGAHAFLGRFTDADGGHKPPWCATTRPWAQAEAEKTIDDYESAVVDEDGEDSGG